MSTNGYLVHGETRMNTADLAVGDKLVQVESYGYGSESRFYEWTIEKILKTRLVLTRPGNVSKLTLRIIVTYSENWPSCNGDVTHRVEGSGDRYYNRITLYTADDPKLAELRKDNELRAIRLDAERAIKELSGSHLSPERAEQLIATLNTYIDSTKN